MTLFLLIMISALLIGWTGFLIGLRLGAQARHRHRVEPAPTVAIPAMRHQHQYNGLARHVESDFDN